MVVIITIININSIFTNINEVIAICVDFLKLDKDVALVGAHFDRLTHDDVAIVQGEGGVEHDVDLQVLGGAAEHLHALALWHPIAEALRVGQGVSDV